MNRRRFLSALAATSGAGLAGCLSDNPDEPVATLALVEVLNRTGVSLSVTLEAWQDGTQVHEESYPLDGVEVRERDDIGAHGFVHDQQVVDEWMGAAAEYELRFSVPEEGLEASFDSTDPVGSHANVRQSELEGECYFVRAEVGDGSGNATPETQPERIDARGIVYDHDVFGREHAGDCS